MHIIREVAGEFERPVLLFSGGKDSVVMLHLAAKAFAPAAVPFPVLHVDTGHNFPEVIDYRDRAVERYGVRLVVASVQDAHRLRAAARAPRRHAQPAADRAAARGDRRRTSSTPSSAAVGATRRRPAPRSACSACATSSASGTRDGSAPSSGTSTTAGTAPASTCACSRCRTGPSSTSGEYLAREDIELPVDLLRARARGVPARRHVAHAGRVGRTRKGDETVERRIVRYRTVGDMSCTGAVDCDAATSPRSSPRSPPAASPSAAPPAPTTGCPRQPWKTASARGTSDERLTTGTHELLRFATAGSVDDGKSTLVGRLLLRHQVGPRRPARRRRARERSPAASTAPTSRCSPTACAPSASRASRSTSPTATSPRRSARSSSPTPPGTCSTRATWSPAPRRPSWPLVLVDARHGVVEQTRRHAAVAALLGVRHLALAVNKMDLVGFDQAVFDAISARVRRVRGGARHRGRRGDPALGARRATTSSTGRRARPGTPGRPCSSTSRRCRSASDPADEPLRFPVQYVIRPQTAEHPDYRGYAGRVASRRRARRRPRRRPAVRADDHRRRHRRARRTARSEAFAPQSVSLRLADDSTSSRGDLIAAAAGRRPTVRRTSRATSARWPSVRSRAGDRVLVEHGTRTVRAMVDRGRSRGSTSTRSSRRRTPSRSAQRHRPRSRLRLAEPLAADAYSQLRRTGAFLLVDDRGSTLAAGMAVARAMSSRADPSADQSAHRARQPCRVHERRKPSS